MSQISLPFLRKVEHTKWSCLVSKLLLVVVQFLTAIGTADETGEHIGLACSGGSAFVLAKFLHTGKGFFVNNGFMSVLENLPLVWRVFEFLFASVRLLAGFEVDHVTKGTPQQDSMKGKMSDRRNLDPW